MLLALGALLAACSSAEDDGGGRPSGSGAGAGAGSAAPGPGGAGALSGTSGAGSGAPATAGAGGTTPIAVAGSMSAPPVGGSGDDAGSAGTGTGGSAGSAGAAGASPDAGSPGPIEQGLVGWASVEGDGVPTTTGGLGGAVVTPSSAAELLDFAASDEPLVIELEGTYSVPRLQVASNKTLVGVGAGATIEGGIRIRGSDSERVENVIVKNLRVHGASSDVDGDAVQIYFAHHVWIDHCEIWDGADGNLDIVHASSWVTVSWTKIRYSSSPPDPNHRFASLIGHSDDNADEDTDRLKVTFHHDYWAEGIVERMPRVRFGQVHVFNNLYGATGNNYAIGGGLEASLLIEGNLFEGVNDPHIFYDDEPTAQIVANDNAYVGTTGAQQTGQGSAFDPPYPYTLDDADTLGDLIRANVGPQ